jgi:hypothetical protein
VVTELKGVEDLVVLELRLPGDELWAGGASSNCGRRVPELWVATMGGLDG